MKLYEINQQIEDLIMNADDNGEINAEQFEALTIAKQDKQEGVIKAIKMLDHQTILVDSELERLAKVKKRIKSQKEWLNKYLSDSMQQDGIERLDFVLFKAAFRKNPPSLVIDDETKLPSHYIEPVITSKILKDKIKEDIKAGVTVEGCHLEQTTRLQIS